MRATIPIRLLPLLVLLTLGACAAQPPADTPLNVTSKQVHKATYRIIGCEEPAGEWADPCLCRIDTKAAQTGIAELDKVLLDPAQHQIQIGEEIPRCFGEAVTADKDIGMHSLQTGFRVTRNDARWLSVVYEHYVMPAGAAHGLAALQPLIYDRKQQRWLEQDEIVPPHRRRGAGLTVMRELRRVNLETYDNGLWLRDLYPETLFTERGCRYCVIYPDKDGWTVQFAPYAIGPYAAGMPSVRLTREDVGR